MLPSVAYAQQSQLGKRPRLIMSNSGELPWRFATASQDRSEVVLIVSRLEDFTRPVCLQRCLHTTSRTSMCCNGCVGWRQYWWWRQQTKGSPALFSALALTAMCFAGSWTLTSMQTLTGKQAMHPLAVSHHLTIGLAAVACDETVSDRLSG